MKTRECRELYRGGSDGTVPSLFLTPPPTTQSTPFSPRRHHRTKTLPSQSAVPYSDNENKSHTQIKLARPFHYERLVPTVFVFCILNTNTIQYLL